MLQGFHGFPSPALKWWTTGNSISDSVCLAAWQPKGATSLADSYINLAHPPHSAYSGGTPPTFDPLIGWTFNGTDQYLITREMNIANMSWCVRFSNGATNAAARVVFGACAGGGGYEGVAFYNTYSSDNHIYKNGNYVLVAPRVTEGVFAATPTECFNNGVSEGAMDNTMSSNYIIMIGALNLGGAITQYFSGNIVALALYSAALTNAQIIAVSNAMALL